jgi:hypothetical protein
MGVRFSLVYPTRHRPELIRQALRFLTHQTYPDFEVIVSDNYTDPALSCEEICRDSGLANLRYVRPPAPVGMVENWNHGYRFATGDYVAYFTDKMLLLPDTLARAAGAIGESGFEIVSWPDAGYTPSRIPDYFGAGTFTYTTRSNKPYLRFDPREELSRKGRASVRRSQQDAASYARGKICFGAFSRVLCDRIIRRAGALFHPIAPDYTSMILGLSLARSAGQLSGSGIVHLMTDLSNGALTATRDDLALRFLRDLGGLDQILAELPVPGVYSSQNNIVARDYSALRKRFGLEFDFDLAQWLVYMEEDLQDPGRSWSSSGREAEHKAAFTSFLSRLDQSQRQRFEALRARPVVPEQAPARATRTAFDAIGTGLKRTAVSILPRHVIRLLKSVAARPATARHSTLESVRCESIDDVLRALPHAVAPGSPS